MMRRRMPACNAIPMRSATALRALVVAFAVAIPSLGWAQETPDPLPYRNPKLSAEARAHDLVSRMTLDEKASQLEDWAVSIPRLGIPDYQAWNEALHGVARSGYSTVFPQAIGMAATWDTAMVHAMGDVIALEGRAKYNQAQRQGNHRIYFGLTFWSPNINIFRDPRWGRGQETYGEDPYLTGQMGVAFIAGMQGDDPDHPKVIATSKHFAVHSGPEPLRHDFDAHPSPRDLEETYLPAFRATVIDGHVKSVMCAYNAVDGEAACANKNLLVDHLRKAWNFQGFVVSDCAAINNVVDGHHNAPDITHAAAISLAAGTDLSCSVWAPGFNTLADAVRQGLVSEELVTQAAERLYKARFELGLFDPQGSNPLDAIPFSATADAESRKTALKAAEEAIVLLKNDGTLPLKTPVRRVAVVGPTADLLPAIEGNYNGIPLHPVSPLDGILKQMPGARVVYAQGSTLAEGTNVPIPRNAFGDGLKTEFFATPDWTGRPVATLLERRIQDDWSDAPPVPALLTSDYSVRWTGTIAVPVAGKYNFHLESLEDSFYSPRETYRVYLDGALVSEGVLKMGGPGPRAAGSSPSAPPYPAPGGRPANFPVVFADTKAHDFRVEYSHSGDHAGGGLMLEWAAPADTQLAQAQLDEAVSAARQSDAVVAFVGLSPKLEGEEMRIKIDGFDGGDRTSLALPAPQEKLLEALGATGKPLIVVVLSGSAVALSWAKDHASAILEAWYPGVEGGTAIAKTLLGENNPAGRLPITFYAGSGDLPPFADYSMKGRTYRYFQGKPLWGFGFGLSYSTFHYGAAKLSAEQLSAGDPLTVTVPVTNSSKLAGEEVVEAYLKTPQKDGPIRSLVAFARVALEPGETRQVALHLSPRSMSSVDDQGNRSILAGQYQLAVGGAQPNETQAESEADFTVTGAVKLPE